MRKTILILALVVTAVAASSAGAKRASTFTFCTDPTFPPMELASSSGKISGFDVEMASALAKTFGETSKAVKTAFGGLIPALHAKKCDTDYGDFAAFTHQQNKDLYRDLTVLLARSRLGGFGIALDITPSYGKGYSAKWLPMGMKPTS